MFNVDVGLMLAQRWILGSQFLECNKIVLKEKKTNTMLKLDCKVFNILLGVFVSKCNTIKALKYGGIL